MSSTERGSWGQFRRTQDISASGLHWRLPSSSSDLRDVDIRFNWQPWILCKVPTWVRMGVCLPVLTLRWTGHSSRMWLRLRPETTGIDATSSTHPPTLSPGSAWTRKWMKGLVWWCTFGLSVIKSHVFTVSKINKEEVVTKHLSSPSEGVKFQEFL